MTAAAMVSLQTSLVRALRDMARSSQSDPVAVENVLYPLSIALNRFHDLGRAAQRLPTSSLRDMLQVAGWMLACIRPSSNLPALLLQNIHGTFKACINMVTNCLIDTPPMDLTTFQQLLEPRSRPHIPGAMAWMGDTAAQLVSSLGQHPDAAQDEEIAALIIDLWQQLARMWLSTTHTPQSALGVLPPSMLRLLQHLAPHPSAPSRAAAAASIEAGHYVVDPATLLVCVDIAAMVCGTVLQLHQDQQLQHLAPHLAASPAASAAGPINTSSSSSITREGCQRMVAAITEQEDFWWCGVATVASMVRARAAHVSANGSGTVATTSSSGSLNSSSSSVRGLAGRLCPRYHNGAAWPIDKHEVCTAPKLSPVSSSVHMLLQREVLRSQPWALQQLQLHMTTQQASSSRSRTAGAPPIKHLLGMQWPLVFSSVSMPSVNSGSGSSTSRTSTSGITSTAGCTCRCRSPMCHMCTPSPPVTLRQLRLLLEVVCLTCTESSTRAHQALLLLALLLQRASFGVRAAFLNSADGVRLLVALQQAPTQSNDEVNAQKPVNTWCLARNAGASSGYLAEWEAYGGPSLLPAVSRAASAVAWCFLEVASGAASTGGAAGLAATTDRPGHGLVTPTAVECGSVLYVKSWSREIAIHLLGVSPTSLRLAAGVVPSLALFATMEGLLRRCFRDDLPVLLTTLLAAVCALLDQEGGSSCGCNQVDGHTGPANSTHPSTPTQTSGSSSNGGSAVTGSSNISASANGVSNGIGSTAASSSTPSPGPSSAMDILPGVLEAISSAAVTVSKLLMDQCQPGDPRPTMNREVPWLTDVVVLGARLSDAVVQLALQLQQKQGMSRALLQLMQGAQCLLRQAAAAATVVLDQQRHIAVLAGLGGLFVESPAEQLPGVEAARAAACIEWETQNLTQRRRLLLALLQTAQTRLAALQHAATRAAGQGGPGPTGAAAAAAAAAALPDSGAGRPGATLPVAEPSWCPLHGSSPSPAALSLAEGTPGAPVSAPINSSNPAVSSIASTPLWLARCNFVDCRNLCGPSEVGLVTNRCRTVCQRCGVACYCSPGCAKLAWPAHHHMCGRLAAALGRTAGSSSNSSNSATCSSNSASSTSTADGAHAAASGSLGVPRGLGGPLLRPGAGKSGARSGSSGDAGPSQDQGADAASPPAAAVRMCAWCGVTAPKLLRCGRCKAAWYCGADHQRAAWKAGHKKQCGTAAAAAAVSGRS